MSKNIAGLATWRNGNTTGGYFPPAPGFIGRYKRSHSTGQAAYHAGAHAHETGHETGQGGKNCIFLYSTRPHYLPFCTTFLSYRTAIGWIVAVPPVKSPDYTPEIDNGKSYIFQRYADMSPRARQFIDENMNEDGSGFFALHNNHRYSSRTSGHQSALRRAVSHLPNLSLETSSRRGDQTPGYLPSMVKDTLEAAIEACRAAARTRNYSGGLFRQALTTAETVQIFDGMANPGADVWPLADFCTEKELRGAVQAYGGGNTSEIPSPEGTSFYERLRKEAGLARKQARIDNAAESARRTAEDAEREKINQLVEIARAEYAPVYCAAWKRGESPETIIPGTPGIATYGLNRLNRYSLPVMLRLKERAGHCPVVETSKGAEFPYRADDCADIFRRMTALREGLEAGAEGLNLPKFGAFKIDELTGDKIRAGCHVISWDEIRDFVLRTQPEIIGRGE